MLYARGKALRSSFPRHTCVWMHVFCCTPRVKQSPEQSANTSVSFSFFFLSFFPFPSFLSLSFPSFLPSFLPSLISFFFFPFLYFLSSFLGPHLQHMDVPRQQHAIWDLQHSSQQCRILKPLNEARDGNRNLMVPRQIC